MLANNKPQRCRPANARQSEPANQFRAGAAPESVAQLQLLASSPVADLEAITKVIREDEALTNELLRVAADVVNESDTSVSVGELIVHLGLEQLRRMAAEITLRAPRIR